MNHGPRPNNHKISPSLPPRSPSPSTPNPNPFADSAELSTHQNHAGDHPHPQPSPSPSTTFPLPSSSAKFSLLLGMPLLLLHHLEPCKRDFVIVRVADDYLW
ncbi:hypothetical protein AKJ16_DCAP09393 [Drosera capensis]